MCEVSVRDTVGEESLCAEMVGDRAFIRPAEGSLLLFWDLSWVQSERAADRRVSSLFEHAHTHRQKCTCTHYPAKKFNDMLTVMSVKLPDFLEFVFLSAYRKSVNS